MEYEIAEEGWLLDASNNPSLDNHTRPAIASWSRPKPKKRKAEPIPEEAETA